MYLSLQLKIIHKERALKLYKVLFAVVRDGSYTGANGRSLVRCPVMRNGETDDLNMAQYNATTGAASTNGVYGVYLRLNQIGETNIEYYLGSCDGDTLTITDPTPQYKPLKDMLPLLTRCYVYATEDELPWVLDPNSETAVYGLANKLVYVEKPSVPNTEIPMALNRANQVVNLGRL